ncbi:hypothetical protein SAMN06272735_9167 [Streptomyces sp. TLI_55]|uniref:hypothetical protein n=1 Tax=Streptomyces sp. TLI_55 TaxID=1938861 RepID=UPI000BCF1496|nr:hypothetical protein [Streptomyces sp. TLI_55]SNX88676.1 hypothetical protein SAMN06272735_9167 [Streptomyces sp. TLI_55]
MARLAHPLLRPAVTVVVLACVFVVVNTQVVYAAGSDGGTGDLLSPLNITSSEGIPIDGYELGAQGGSIFSFQSQSLAFALSGLFTVIRLLVGLAGWAIELAFRFPLLALLTKPAQRVADAYNTVVVERLGLKGLLLAWAFIFAAFMIVRGRVGRGLGEIFLTLAIAALAASAFVRPDYLLTPNGPLGQTQQVAAEVAEESVNSYDWGGKLASLSPCDRMAGQQEAKCLQEEAAAPVAATEVARPLQDSITNALIVKPYMLLEYGRILDPAKPADRKAYAVHLKWITGGYKAGSGPVSEERKDYCRKIKGPAKEYCERGATDAEQDIPEGADDVGLAPGQSLTDIDSAAFSDEARQFAAFLDDLKNSGEVGKACAAYAEKPTWWRVGGAFLLLVAAFFICGMLLSSAIVLLGTQGIGAAAAAGGAMTFIAAMLPGPPRQSVWKWLSIWGIAVLAMVGICAFVPFFGIAVDATITNGPDLMVERILLIDVLAIAGAAGHRRLLTGISSFGRRMAMRMRYSKIGGTHLPGDTSELGAALAMNSPTALGGYGGGLRAFGGGGRFALLGTRQRLLGALSSLFDGAGMPVDTGRILADASAEAGRGLAPVTAAAAAGQLGARLGLGGARLGARGAYWLLIGRRPDRDKLAQWRKPTADGDPNTGPYGGPGAGPDGGGPRRPGGPPDRYRDDDGQITDRHTGEVLHDQHRDRTLLSTRAHNRLVRYRGYRILHRGGRLLYGATLGLPANVDRTRHSGSRYAQDARQQVRVWANTGREDGHAWGDVRRHTSQVLRDHLDDRGGPGPFPHSRRLPTLTAADTAGTRAARSSPLEPSGSTVAGEAVPLSREEARRWAEGLGPSGAAGQPPVERPVPGPPEPSIRPAAGRGRRDGWPPASGASSPPAPSPDPAGPPPASPRTRPGRASGPSMQPDATGPASREQAREMIRRIMRRNEERARREREGGEPQ